jgi:hypothetical protein
VAQTSFFVNGVNGATGEPLEAPDPRRIAAMLRGNIREDKGQPALLRWLKHIARSAGISRWGLPMGVDPLDPAQSGWGVVFHEFESPEVRAALEPLTGHRAKLLGSNFRILEAWEGEDWRAWLTRHGAEPGSVIPHRVPYYLLLVGDPARLTFDFQHALSVEYAVGRLCFDTPEEYTRYAESVIDLETSAAVPTGRSAVFFGTRHDPSTELSADYLLRPLAPGAERWGFAYRELQGEAATRANLGEVFTAPAGTAPPSLLFSASHGVGWPRGHAAQRATQGAILCQEWPGHGAVAPAHLYTGDDLPADARVHGMVSFFFACYGAGTPERDEFCHEPGLQKPGQPPPTIADAPFVARLPQRLLAHPQGGALAVIGHVERAWGYSILGASGEPQLQPFQNALGAILSGWPVGHAMKDFRQRYAVLSTRISEMLERASYGAALPEEELAVTWAERNDARNYAVLGDPAVRLRVEALAG